MIDRKARDQMSKAIRAYMNEEITAFKLDEVLNEVTEDRTAQTVGRALWFHYDDCKDHKVVATKEEWDYFNRLLLLLESEGELETITSWRAWHLRQAAAALLLIVFLVIAFRVGLGEHLFAYALPFGPLSMLLAWFNSPRRRQPDHTQEAALTPFPSVRSLLSVRRQVAGFARKRYPSSIIDRRIRDPIIDRLMWVPWSIAWCMFSPVALFFQMLPEKESTTRIKTPEPPAVSTALPHAAQP